MATKVAKQVGWASGLDAFAGLWLLVSPFVIAYPAGTLATYRNVVLGALVMALAAVRATNPVPQAWIGWLASLIGLFIMASPWMFGFATAARPMWNDLITGGAIVAISWWSATTPDEFRTEF